MYVILADRLEQRALAAMSAGADVDPDEVRDRFDAALFAENEEDPERLELLESLGLR